MTEEEEEKTLVALSSSSAMGGRNYAAALQALSSLITQRKRGDGSNRGNAFDLMFLYLQIAELEGPLSKLSVIHVAGTKGKGSTCNFSESILRACGYKTGLFTSPHLVDIRERFRINGNDVSEELFLEHFWWCWDRFEVHCTGDIPMPTYFRFLTLLGFRIFIFERVDVAILEVGLGGRFDSTNVVKAPAVCGISSLGFDHMQILGHTLPEIAGEKAGIFKPGVPAFTVPQRDDAMEVLQKRAHDLAISLQVVPPLELHQLEGRKLGLSGDHQLINAALAVALCGAWAQRRGEQEHVAMLEKAKREDRLPEMYIKGLVSAQLLGRAQIIQDSHVKGLTFFLDGAHSPESMEVCAKWFCSSIQRLNYMPVNTDFQGILTGEQVENNLPELKDELPQWMEGEAWKRRILLFNCMPERDPKALMPPLLSTCNYQGMPFHWAMFAPGCSSYTSVLNGLSQVPFENPNNKSKKDLSWQLFLQKTWESLLQSHKSTARPSSMGHSVAFEQQCCEGDGEFLERRKANNGFSSAVAPSLPAALQWLRQYAARNPSLHLQVVVMKVT